MKITNQDKVFWPDEGFTKGELCDYYAAIADTLLPYLHDRPVLIVRYPDGIAGKNFYQWNVPAGHADWVRRLLVSARTSTTTATSRRASASTTATRCSIIANLGCIPLHVLAARADDLESLRLPHHRLRHRRGAVRARDRARALRCTSCSTRSACRASRRPPGRSGLHVLVPLGGVPFAAAGARRAARAHLARAAPRHLDDRAHAPNAAERACTSTPGRPAARARSSRPTPCARIAGARVSTPLTWDEVGFNLDPARFTMFSVPERVAAHGDPMADMLTHEVDVARAVDALAKLM